MKQKLYQAMMCSALVLSQVNAVYAERGNEPYVLAQNINNVPVDKETCLTLLRQANEDVESESEVHEPVLRSLEEMTAELEQVAQSFNELNEEIAHLESNDGEDTLGFAEHAWDDLIEQIYAENVQEDEHFRTLTQSQQLKIIEEDDRVVQFQEYMSHLQQTLNEKMVERDALENQYNQLLYDIENYETVLEREQTTKSQYNQCALYPYSMNRQTDEWIVNANVQNIAELLVSLDQQLQRIVPLAYRKVSFEQIAQKFDTTRMVENRESKQRVFLDEEGKVRYTYAQELNVYDVELLANLSLNEYEQTNDLQAHYDQYAEVLAMKESQFQYFYTINEERFLRIKEVLFTYLMEHGLTDQRTVQQIEQFQQRYQMEFVQFDEENQEWQLVADGESGYYAKFLQQELYDVPRSIIYSIPTEDETDSESESEPSSRLDQLKDKMKANKTKKSDKKLPKKDKKLPKDPENHSSSSKKKKSNHKKLSDQLPTTGEQRQWTIVGGVLLLLGIVGLIYNSYKKRQQKVPLDEISLD